MPILNMVWWGSKWGNIWEPLNLTVTTSWLDATITWEDNEIWTIPPTSFVKSELVRKVGSAPTSPSDWTLVVTETVKDTYKVSGYVDSWLTDWITYYYRVFSYSDLGGISYCDAVNVTPSGWWWQPWANTLWYRPLTSVTTSTDQSWNNKNLTTYTGTVSYWTYKWVDCWYFSGAWINNSSLSLWNTITLNFWVYIENTTYSNQIVSVLWPSTWDSSHGTNVLSFWYNTNDWKYSLSSFDGSAEVFIYENITGKRVNVCYMYDNWTCTIYVDWTYKNSYSHNIIWSTHLSLGYWNSGDKMYGWGISNVILEDKVWTATEITDYYNQTKWDYWIS